MIASTSRYPGEARQGSCDKNGQCSQDYTIHCRKCFDYCQRQGPGQYDTAVITLAFNPNKRPADPGNKKIIMICQVVKKKILKLVCEKINPFLRSLLSLRWGIQTNQNIYQKCILTVLLLWIFMIWYTCLLPRFDQQFFSPRFKFLCFIGLSLFFVKVNCTLNLKVQTQLFFYKSMYFYLSSYLQYPGINQRGNR